MTHQGRAGLNVPFPATNLQNKTLKKELEL